MNSDRSPEERVKTHESEGLKTQPSTDAVLFATKVENTIPEQGTGEDTNEEVNSILNKTLKTSNEESTSEQGTDKDASTDVEQNPLENFKYFEGPLDTFPFHFEKAVMDLEPPTSDIWTPRKLQVNKFKRPVQDIEILGQATKRHVQGDTGANVSATNDISLLWKYQTLRDPIPITTYDGNEESPCQAIGKGVIKIIANDDSVIEFKALYIPMSTGTIISPDHYMKTNPEVKSFTHYGEESGTGYMKFQDRNGETLTEINMNRNDGLWYTSNKVLVNNNPVIPVLQEEGIGLRHVIRKCKVNSTRAMKNLELWHQRYGHISHRTLAATSKCVEGIPELPNTASYFACPFCDKAKLRKAAGKKTSSREAFVPGTTFHMDLAFIHGPKEVKTEGKRKAKQTTVMKDRQGHTAYLLIICAATRYIWAFPLKSKHPPIGIIDAFLQRHGNAQSRMGKQKISTTPNGALAKSQSFAILMAKRQYDIVQQPIELEFDTDPIPSKQYIVRTDNGGELAGSTKFQEMVCQHGYNLETTAPGTSNQNGMAERPNRTLKERVRCLLYTANLGAEFWADALLHAVWLYNRTYHQGIEKTPFEAYTGRRPYVDKLITFGGRITAKQPGPRQTALDPHSYEGIFLGFGATTEKIKYWDQHNQTEKTATSKAMDELHYGTAPDKRPPAAKHLIEVTTGTPHEHLSSHEMKEQPMCIPCTSNEKKTSKRMALPRRGSQAPPLALTHLAPDAIIKDSPLPYTATAAKVSTPESHDELVRSIETLNVTLNIFEPAVSETITLHSDHPSAGLQLEAHPEYKDTVILKGIHPGTTASKEIRRWKSRLRGSIIRLLDEVTITSPAQFREVYAKKKAQNRNKASTMTIQFAHPRWRDMNGEGLPNMAFDQLNVVAHHLSTMDTNQPSWDQKAHQWPPIRDTDIPGIINKGLAMPKLTRRKLKDRDDWQKFKESEWVQLDKYHRQGMFGTPIPRPRDAIVLPWVWSYIYKIDPVTLEAKPKSRGTCNGGKQHAGKIVSLAETYAACVEQPAHRLTWALIAALDYIAIGTDIGNAFAEADAPDTPFFMHVDEPFRDWWTEHLGYDPIPRGYVIPICKNLQGHPEGPRLWNKHIDRILIDDFKFKPTTHEPCLYWRKNKDGKPILLLRQVDDFLIAAPTEKECQEIRNEIQTKMINPLNDLGVIKRFNGVDIDQTADYIKVSAETYIDKINKHHGWQDEVTKDLPVPMRNDTQFMNELQTAVGPTDEKEQRELEEAMGFSYRQAIGELIFAMSTCRVDIAAAVIQLAQHAAAPAKIHYQATKKVFAYLNHTKSHGLYYWRPKRNKTHGLPTKKHPTPITKQDRLAQFMDKFDARTLHGASDATWGNDKANRRSVSGTAILLAGAVIFYRCQLQPTVALSSTESEFAAMADTGKAALYLRSILDEIGINQMLPTMILADNAGAIAIANAQQPTRRTKHVELKHFAILQWTDEDKLRYEPTPTEFNYADSTTKVLGRIKFYEQNDILTGRRRPLYFDAKDTGSTTPNPYTINIASFCGSTSKILRNLRHLDFTEQEILDFSDA